LYDYAIEQIVEESEIDKQSIRNYPKEVSTFENDVDRILKDEQGKL